MPFRILKLVLLSLLLFGLILPSFFLLAEKEIENLGKVCEEICQTEKKPEGLSDKEYKDLLKNCEAYYKAKSEEIEKDITKTQQEKKTLQNQIYILKNKIKNLDYQIYQNKLVIKDISAQISDTKSSIADTSLRINEAKEKLVNILRLIYEEDQKSFVEILLSENKLSDFFNNLVALEELNAKNQEILEHIKRLKSYLEKQKESLDREKRGLEKVIAIQNLQREESSQTKKQQEYILKMTEAEYQKYLKEKEEIEERAEEISNRLWKLLIGVREVPEYGEAVEVAKFVEKQTGVRAAFLLGILTQESQIGQNVGQCFLEEPKTGMGVIAYNGRKWPRVMQYKRDVPIFLEIIENLNRTKNLNLKFNKVPISCWIPCCVPAYGRRHYVYKGISIDEKGNITCPKKGYVPFGFGGAMGAAQFIPSTWKKYEDEIKKRTGETPDPWDFRHASLASALLLRKCGALSNERSAAACYLGVDYLGYADSVLELAKCHQQYIDTGSMSLVCQKKIGLD